MDEFTDEELLSVITGLEWYKETYEKGGDYGELDDTEYWSIVTANEKAVSEYATRRAKAQNASKA